MKRFKISIIFLFIVSILSINTQTTFANEINPANDVKIEKIEQQNQEEIIFSDIVSTAWYYDYVTEMVNAGIVFGNPDGTFRPNEFISIGEYCTMLCRALDIKVDEPKENSHWASEYVKHIKYARGWKVGMYKTNFDEKMVREEAIEVGLRMFGYRHPTHCAYLENPFSDTENILVYSKDYLINAYHLGIISGNGNGELKPYDFITRAEACKLISNLLKTDLSEPIKTELIKRVKIELKGEESPSFYNDIHYGLICFEDSVIESLSQNGKILITNEHQSQYLPNITAEANGCYLQGSKTIVCFTKGSHSSLFFGIGSTLRHEIGHYIYFNMLTIEDKEIVRKSFNSKDEVELLVQASYSDYCKTNIYEYFAEFISTYSQGSNNKILKESNLPIIEVVEKYIK